MIFIFIFSCCANCCQAVQLRAAIATRTSEGSVYDSQHDDVGYDGNDKDKDEGEERRGGQSSAVAGSMRAVAGLCSVLDRRVKLRLFFFQSDLSNFSTLFCTDLC